MVLACIAFPSKHGFSSTSLSFHHPHSSTPVRAYPQAPPFSSPSRKHSPHSLPLRSLPPSSSNFQDPSSSSSSSSNFQDPSSSSSSSNFQDPSSSSLQTVLVEDRRVSLEGVARVDREQLNRPSWSRLAILCGGDVLALLAFAAIGRMSHGMPVFDWDVFRTADPFIAGWLIGSYFLGGYAPEGQGLKGFQMAVFAAAKSWALGIPVGLVIRGITAGHPPVQEFILVSMVSTFVLLVGWRASFAAIFPNNLQRSKDRQGTIFELFELLSSLVRRW